MLTITIKLEASAMNDENIDELGPVDYVVVEFPADKANFSGEMAAELRGLIESGAVRLLDLLFLRKNLDGSVEGFESHDFGDGELDELRALETELAMLLAEEDVESIGAALEPGSVAAVLIWENAWAAPFGSAVRRSGGQLVASGRIPIQALRGPMILTETAAERAPLRCDRRAALSPRFPHRPEHGWAGTSRPLVN